LLENTRDNAIGGINSSEDGLEIQQNNFKTWVEAQEEQEYEEKEFDVFDHALEVYMPCFNNLNIDHVCDSISISKISCIMYWHFFPNNKN
jgi:hypothetical protein